MPGCRLPYDWAWAQPPRDGSNKEHVLIWGISTKQPCIRRLEEDARAVYLMMNTNCGDQGVVNAKALAEVDPKIRTGG